MGTQLPVEGVILRSSPGILELHSQRRLRHQPASSVLMRCSTCQLRYHHSRLEHLPDEGDSVFFFTRDTLVVLRGRKHRVAFGVQTQNITVAYFVIGGDGILRYQGRLCVSDVDGLREMVMTEAHRCRYTIHPNSTKMYHNLREFNWWINMKLDVAIYVAKCMEVTGSRCGKSLLQKCRTVDPCGSALPQTLHSQKTNVTDVCMDESVVSSDPIIAFFLDEVVVKDWHKNFESWRALIRERKSAAIKRAWPDSVSHFDEYNASTLFIEDALSNIEAAEQGDLDDHEKEMALAYLQKDGGSLYSRSKIQEMAGCYPFESLRATADILFLRGSSDFVVAKQAIVSFLLDEGWRHIIDDFSATFGATKHSSFLDDEGVPALKEASQLLPKISSPTIHPKVAQKKNEKIPSRVEVFIESRQRKNEKQVDTFQQDAIVLGIEKNGYLRAYGPGKSITEYFSGRPTKIQLIKQVESIRKKSNEHVEKVKREAKEESEEMKKEMEDKIAELDKR
ncbi:hypothetical protein T459_17033 [Capsicum annuum]|uniref:Integrase zinc-binding domain-containing protein n=1 Tax=Capsicum annuum TaxID=4072 RepID=A0A2G2ZAQ1_CAPAN|nr:hypothetical protein T459_17033 [Capsicum annuum]